MGYLVDLFNRAMHNRKLSPRERAALKALQGAALGFVISLAPQLMEIMAGRAHFNLTESSISAVLGAFILFLCKLWFAQGDQHLGDILEAYAQAEERKALDQLVVPNPDGSVNVPAVQFTIPMVKAVAQEHTVTHVPAKPDQSKIITAKDNALILPSPSKQAQPTTLLSPTVQYPVQPPPPPAPVLPPSQ